MYYNAFRLVFGSFHSFFFINLRRLSWKSDVFERAFMRARMYARIHTHTCEYVCQFVFVLDALHNILQGYINLLKPKPTGYVMHQQFNIQQL